MLKKLVDAIQGKTPFDLVIRNVRIVNVYQDTVLPGSIGIVDGRIAFTGIMEFPYMAKEEYDGHGQYALPGFVDSHMHLESSMLTPAYFSEIAVSCGTTTVAADPHEIGNVLGLEGVRALVALTRGLSLRVLMMRPQPSLLRPALKAPAAKSVPKKLRRCWICRACPDLGKLWTLTAWQMATPVSFPSLKPQQSAGAFWMDMPPF